MNNPAVISLRGYRMKTEVIVPIFFCYLKLTSDHFWYVFVWSPLISLFGLVSELQIVRSIPTITMNGPN
jgi:hypothetical protein